MPEQQPKIEFRPLLASSLSSTASPLRVQLSPAVLAAAAAGLAGAKPAEPTRVSPPPASAPAPAPEPPAVPSPQPQGESPFDSLPYPSPGDRIKAEDFRKLSQCLQAIYDAYALSSTLAGRTFGEVKLALAAQRYVVVQAMSVFGAQLDNPSDPTLDGRRVLQVVPVVPGDRQVIVYLTESVDTRRFAPDLTNLTYRQALERMRDVLGEAAFTGGSITMPQLVGLTLEQARQALSRR